MTVPAFVRLPGDIIVNTSYITFIKDITGNGYHRVYLDGGSVVDLGPEDAYRLKTMLLPQPKPEEPKEPKTEAPRKRGRPPKKKAEATT